MWESLCATQCEGNTLDLCSLPSHTPLCTSQPCYEMKALQKLLQVRELYLSISSVNFSMTNASNKYIFIYDLTNFYLKHLSV